LTVVFSWLTDDRFQHFLLPLGQRRGHDLQSHADRDADGDGQSNTDEHGAYGSVVPLEEGAHDADDERGFETLAQADEERANENALHVPPVS
jgi:hypothetical protein